MIRPAWTVQCPHCGARVGGSCVYPNGTLRASHQERVKAYLKEHGPLDILDEDDSRKADNSTPGTVNTR